MISNSWRSGAAKSTIASTVCVASVAGRHLCHPNQSQTRAKRGIHSNPGARTPRAPGCGCLYRWTCFSRLILLILALNNVRNQGGRVRLASTLASTGTENGKSGRLEGREVRGDVQAAKHNSSFQAWTRFTTGVEARRLFRGRFRWPVHRRFPHFVPKGGFTERE